MKNCTPILAAVLWLCPIGLMAQVQKGEITQDKKIKAEITQDEKHQYNVKLGSNKYAFFKLMPKGTDLKITTYDPSGKKIEIINQSRRDGTEKFSLVSGTKGDYLVEVSQVDGKAPTGFYELSLELLKPKAVSAAEKVDELFTSLTVDEVPGAVIAVVKDGKPIYTKGFGMANLEYGIPLNPATIFDIASLSKQFTAFSILLLEKEGKLSLDDDIRKYLPEIPDFGKKITLRHLASHTSGLRDQWTLLEMAGWRVPDVITQQDVMEMVRRQKGLNFAPGDEFLYSNTGFMLLGEVIAKVSGQTYLEFLEKRIFQPLNMKSTFVLDDYDKIVKNRSYSYYDRNPGYEKGVLNISAVGQGNIFSTASDMSMWMLNLLDPKVGGREIIKKMNTPALLNNGKTFGGGLGQFVGQYKGLEEVQHRGRTAGYKSYLTHFPAKNLSVLVMSNSSGVDVDGLAVKVADIYLEGQLEEKPKVVAKDPAAKIKLVVDTSIRLREELLKSYSGDYEFQPGASLRVSGVSGQLTGKIENSNFKLLPISTKEFLIEGSDVTLTFVENDKNEIMHLAMNEGGEVRELKKVEPFDKSSVAFSDYEGEYYSSELTNTFDIMVTEGKLLVQPRNIKLSRFILEPVKKDVFLGSSPLFRNVTFVRDEKMNIVGLRVSNERVMHLLFNKTKS